VSGSWTPAAARERRPRDAAGRTPRGRRGAPSLEGSLPPQGIGACCPWTGVDLAQRRPQARRGGEGSRASWGRWQREVISASTQYAQRSGQMGCLLTVLVVNLAPARLPFAVVDLRHG
jgi:hypothetical protein